jgi:hypothetical protein
MSDEHAFEAWKHYAAAGGADKDRMIQIATLLLGFSAAIAGFTFDHAVKGHQITEPLAAAGLSIGGMIVAFASALVTLLYGGYANRNWARAEQIAESYGWSELQRANTPLGSSKKTTPAPSVLASWALYHSNPHPLDLRLAPVFLWFFLISALSFCAHLSIFLWTVLTAAWPW